LAELEVLCSKGDAQTELVMFVMLRIVEDVAVLQTLEQNQRRKEIYQALVSQMDTIFCFLLTLLERHYKVFYYYFYVVFLPCKTLFCELIMF
jgi:exportin-5